MLSAKEQFSVLKSSQQNERESDVKKKKTKLKIVIKYDNNQKITLINKNK